MNHRCVPLRWRRNPIGVRAALLAALFGAFELGCGGGTTELGRAARGETTPGGGAATPDAGPGTFPGPAPSRQPDAASAVPGGCSSQPCGQPCSLCPPELPGCIRDRFESYCDGVGNCVPGPPFCQGVTECQTRAECLPEFPFGLPCLLCDDSTQACVQAACRQGTCSVAIPGCSALLECQDDSDCNRDPAALCRPCSTAPGGTICSESVCQGGLCWITYPECGSSQP